MTQSLSARLKQPGLISAPGVFEMISARIADTMGFDVLYMTGYGVSLPISACRMRGWRATPRWSAA